MRKLLSLVVGSGFQETSMNQALFTDEQKPRVECQKPKPRPDQGAEGFQRLAACCREVQNTKKSPAKKRSTDAHADARVLMEFQGVIVTLA